MFQFILFLLLISTKYLTGEDNVELFTNIAKEATNGEFIDKIQWQHSYQVMYGMYLIPMIKDYHSKSKPMKFLEIGLGCVDNYNASSDVIRTSKSIHIWNKLFHPTRDKLFVAEYNEKCALNWQKRGIVPPRVQLLLGDQANKDILQDWIAISNDKIKSDFDIVIDDGGHSNLQILTSFNALWPHVAPGGYYFIEDLHVSRRKGKEDTNGKYIMVDIIKDWIEQLLIPRRLGWKHKIPSGIRFIMCQNHACVIQKCYEHDLARCSGQSLDNKSKNKSKSKNKDKNKNKG